VKSLVAWAGCCVALLAHPAWGQTSRSDHDTAVALFEEGRRLVHDGRCPDAIEKFKASISREATVGARLSVAQCYEATSPLQAWRELKEAELLAASKGDDRATVARSRATALEPKLATIRIAIPTATLGLEVRLDGSRLERSYYEGGVVAVEPGHHTVEALAPGKARWSTSVDAGVGASTSVTVSLQDEQPGGANPPPATPPSGATSAPPPPMPAPPVSRGNELGQTNRTLAFVVGGVGVAGLAVGAVAGILAIGQKSTVDNECGSNYPQCGASSTGPARSDNDKLASESWVSNVGFAIGAAGVLAGVVLYLTAPKPVNTTSIRLAPTLGARSGGVVVVW
jgi:hypothetical protein